MLDCWIVGSEIDRGLRVTEDGVTPLLAYEIPWYDSHCRRCFLFTGELDLSRSLAQDNVSIMERAMTSVVLKPKGFFGGEVKGK